MYTLVYGLSAWILLSGCVCQESAEIQAEPLLNQIQNTYKAAQTLTADLTEHIWLHNSQSKHPITVKSYIKLKKPNFALYRESDLKDPLLASNGSKVWTTFYVGSNELYREQPISSDGHDMPTYLISIKLFFDQNMFNEFPYGGPYVAQAKHHYLGVQTVNEKNYKVLEITARTTPSKPPFETDLLYIGSDGLIHRMTKTVFNKDKHEYIFTNTKVNIPLANTEFAVRPPTGVKITSPFGVQP